MSNDERIAKLEKTIARSRVQVFALMTCVAVLSSWILFRDLSRALGSLDESSPALVTPASIHTSPTRVEELEVGKLVVCDNSGGPSVTISATEKTANLRLSSGDDTGIFMVVSPKNAYTAVNSSELNTVLDFSGIAVSRTIEHKRAAMRELINQRNTLSEEEFDRRAREIGNQSTAVVSIGGMDPKRGGSVIVHGPSGAAVGGLISDANHRGRVMLMDESGNTVN